MKEIERLKLRIAKLRQEYAAWKREHPTQQNEQMINEFLLIKRRLLELGAKFPPAKTPLDEDAALFLQAIPKTPTKVTFGYPYAPVRGSGKEIGPPITLADFLPHLKDFVIATPTTWIVGGIVERGMTRGDCDILHMLPDADEMARIIDFRIYRMLPKELADRVHFLWEQRGARSPFTSFLPLYRLKYERIPDAQVTPMAEGLLTSSVQGGVSAPLSFAVRLRVKGAERLEAEARRAMTEDKIHLFQFFLPQKPCRGYVPGQPQTLDFFISLWDDEQFPVYSSKKADGFHAIAWRDKDKVIIYTEDGEEITKQVPSIVAALKRLRPDRFCLDMEIEAWKGSQHFPREFTASILRTKEVDDSPLIGSVFDVVYFGKEGDIHKLPFSERWKRLQSMNFPQRTEMIPDTRLKLNLLPHHLNRTREELRKETIRLAKLPGSEGNVAKQASAGYDLTGRRPKSWIKFHNSVQFVAIVLEAVETKTKGVFNLKWAILPGKRRVKEKIIRKINGMEVAYGGKTFAVTEKELGHRGDHIVIETETFNVVYDMREEAWDFSAWAPRFMGKTDKPVDTIDAIEKRAIAKRCFQAKIIEKDGKVHYLPGASGEEIPSKEV